MTSLELELGLKIEWIKHDPLGAEPTLHAKFWWQLPTIEDRIMESVDEEGNPITAIVPIATAFGDEKIAETEWHGTNDFGPLWNLIEAKKAELKTDN
jgi:hypothetical protein